eukprot:5457710-Amphidinium_carterae.1
MVRDVLTILATKIRILVPGECFCNCAYRCYDTSRLPSFCSATFSPKGLGKRHAAMKPLASALEVVNNLSKSD